MEPDQIQMGTAHQPHFLAYTYCALAFFSVGILVFLILAAPFSWPQLGLDGGGGPGQGTRRHVPVYIFSLSCLHWVFILHFIQPPHRGGGGGMGQEKN